MQFRFPILKAGVNSLVANPCLQHLFATELSDHEVDIRLIQVLPWHKDIKTTLC